MKKLIALVLFLFNTIFTFSQDNRNYRDVFELNFVNGNIKNSIENINNKNFFLFYLWESNFIIQTKDGLKHSIKNLNFNIQKKELVTKLSSSSFYIYDSSYIDFIMFENKVFKMIDSELYEVIFSYKNINLLKKTNLKFVDEINPLTKEFISRKSFFVNDLFISNDYLTLNKINKKSLISFYGNMEEAMNIFIDKNNLSYKNEADLLSMFNYYKSIN